MSMWEAIGYVSSGLTLVAFLAAIVSFSLRNKSLREEQLIKSVPESERAPLVRDALEFFHVDTSNLTKHQQFNVAVEQIKNRANRHKINSLLIFGVAVVFAILSAYAIYESRDTSEEPKTAIYLSDIVRTIPTSFTRADSRGSAVQVFENGWMVADFSRNVFYAISKDHPIKWEKIKEGYVKGGDPRCDDPQGKEIIHLGFCWYYTLPKSQNIRNYLGKPIAKETRAWVQFQEFGNDLLMYGIPTTKPGVESGVFQTLAAIYLHDEKILFNGSGGYKLVNESTLSGNPYCSSNWYAAQKDQGLPQTLRQLIASGACQKAVGTDVYITENREIKLL